MREKSNNKTEEVSKDKIMMSLITLGNWHLILRTIGSSRYLEKYTGLGIPVT